MLIVEKLVAKFYERILRRPRDSFPGSAGYWRERYAKGGNSGAGSYNRLAEFKAETINAFVAEHGVEDVLEFGCGDGAQLGLARYKSYVGVDVAPAAIALCRTKYADDRSKVFYLSTELPQDVKADLTLSLDVIYHLVEDSVFERYMGDLFACSRRWVCIYSSNEDRMTVDAHVRHRDVEGWVRRRQPAWKLVEHVPNRYPFDPADSRNTSFADFYFYGLAGEQ